MINEYKTVRLSSKRQISIPKSFKKFKEGGKALLIGKRDEIILKPIEEVKEIDGFGLLSEKAFAESWNSKENDEAFAYLQ
jgi:bifunctional DNA-binding transcriptional regulator/antitoxin component of YhaV-PrlF toxin-antitoxin module